MLGDILKQAREEKGMTQEQVAIATGRTVSAISKIERGTSKPSKQLLESMCDILGLDYKAVGFAWARMKSEEFFESEIERLEVKQNGDTKTDDAAHTAETGKKDVNRQSDE